MNKPFMIIAGELVDDIRGRTSLTGSGLGTLYTGPGYSSGDFPATDIPTNISDSGFYKIRRANVGIWDIDDFFDNFGNSVVQGDTLKERSVAAVSLDALFVPFTVSTAGEASVNDINSPLELPHFETDNGSDSINSSTLNPFNPFDKLRTTGIAGSGFPTGIEGFWLKYGHSIGIGLTPTGTGTDYQHFDQNFWHNAQIDYNNVKSIAHKAPMILSGWGYDTNDNPVPASGTEPHPETYWNPSLWKTGPIDFRWDDARKVWTIGGGTGSSSCASCDCGCTCDNGYDITLADGTKTTSTMRWVPAGDLEIDVANGHIWLDQTPASGALTYYQLVYDNGSNATWSLDLTPYLQARYTDSISEIDGSTVTGATATSGVSMSGTAVFSLYSTSELMALTVTIDGTIAPTGV